MNLTYRIDDDRMVYATWSEGFRNGGANPVRANSILPPDFESDTLDELGTWRKDQWLDNRLRFNVAAYLMSWDDFAVQIEDPQPGVFQLGYVNLPTRGNPGRGSRADVHAVTMPGRSMRRSATTTPSISEATTLTLTDEDGVDYVRVVEDGARLPLTPDWSGALGIEWRSGGQLVNAQPFARLDFAYVGEVVTNLEGFESVVGQAGVSTQAAYETADFRVGLEGETVERFIVCREPRGRAGRDVPEQPLGAAAPLDHPAADLRAAVPLRFLTRVDIGVPIRSFGQVKMEALGAAVLALDEAAWNENVQRQTDYEVHEQTRSIVLLFAKVDDWPAIEVSKQPGWDRLAEVAVPVMHEIIGKFYPPGGTIIRAMAAKLLAGAASCRTEIRTRPSAPATASTCRSSPTRACAS